jgi:cell division protein ZapA
MPPRRAVELRVGGQTYRVVAGDNDQHLQRLAELVDRKFTEVVPQGRGVTGQQAMFLIAMAFAEEAEEQRARAVRLEAERDRSLHLATRARDVVTRVLKRVDGALSSLPSDGTRSGPPSRDPQALSPLDQLTDPPDIIHEPMLLELMPPSTRDAGWGPALAPASNREPPPLSASADAPGSSHSPPPPSTPANEAAVPRTPRPGLRLIRRSSSDDEPR